MTYIGPITVFMMFSLTSGYPTGGIISPEPVATAIVSSSDLWATVVANIAPLMALVGERHAKEYLRSMTSSEQIFNLSVAPVGILSILISTIRISGPLYLRRLIGRESERRCEAMVEITPVSVLETTPVYVDGKIEIEPGQVKETAFFCCHYRAVTPQAAAPALTSLLSIQRRCSRLSKALDYETIVVLRNVQEMSLADGAALIETLNSSSKPEDLESLKGTVVGDTTISFRLTGISPAATLRTKGHWTSKLLDVVAGGALGITIVSIQIAGYISNNNPVSGEQALVMGIIGYAGIFLGTMALLSVLLQNVVLESFTLGELAKGSRWTISNSSHSRWTAIESDNLEALVAAASSKAVPTELKSRHLRTTICTLVLIASFVVFYLGLRGNPWWVSFSIMLVLWVAAAYRAYRNRTNFTIISSEVGETWTSIPGETVTDTVANTLSMSEVRPSGNAFLWFDSPLRISPMSWSNAQDIIKVAIELTHQKSLLHGWSGSYHAIASPTWGFIVRFHLIVFVPGYVFRCTDSVDMAVELRFTFDHLTQTVIRLLHTCLDQKGDITAYDSSPDRETKIAVVLSGQRERKSIGTGSVSLRAFLAMFTGPRLDQALLLPAVQVCSIYERFYYTSEKQTGMHTLRRRHVDQLAPSASKEQVAALREELEEQHVWDSFVAPLSTIGPKPCRIIPPLPAAHYEQQNRVFGETSGGRW
ncbi:hypothetical protein AA0111_g10857 [Alternaria arborescens]|uniref:hypothetical protein n=1 Tax=Alternaria arborescens TaxID=156630 RepID=UPI0010758431|nr:hypothetical protein AA0111_g10857 [Alternaria arborescens]RYO18105.1 hypothetical protein AA0111_g10857 [Alternaria arborescens]